MKKIVFGIIILSTLISFLICDNRYYQNHSINLSIDVDTILNSVFMIRTFAEYECTKFKYDKDYKIINKKTKQVNKEQLGTAFKIYDDEKYSYFLTNYHVVEMQKIIKILKKDVGDLLVRNSLFDPIIDKMYKSKKIEYYITCFEQHIDCVRISKKINLKLITYDDILDVAVLRSKRIDSFKNNGKIVPVLCANYKWGNSDNVYPGNKLISIGFPQGMGRFIFEGKVLSKTVIYKEKLLDMVVTDNKIMKGCSGGPVFAIRHGKFELVGMTRLIIFKMYPCFIKINKVKDFLRDKKLEFLVTREKMGTFYKSPF